MCNCKDKPHAIIDSLNSDRRYETAIAERNIAWARFRQANELYGDAIAAGLNENELRLFRGRYNEAQDIYENRRAELSRVKVWRKRQ